MTPTDALSCAAADLALPFVAREERFVATPYRDAVGLPTIGYGRRIPSMQHEPVTEPAERARLHDDLTARGHAVLALAPPLAGEPPYRLAAVVSFAYNVGTSAFAGSTLRRKCVARDWDGAAAEFGKWVYGHTPDGTPVKLAGLVARRRREAALFTGVAA